MPQSRSARTLPARQARVARQQTRQAPPAATGATPEVIIEEAKIDSAEVVANFDTNGEIGIAAGGDITNNDAFTDNVVRTSDGGTTWALGARPSFSGPIFGVVYVPDGSGTVVTVGPKGASWSGDDGQSWQPLDSLGYWSAGFANRTSGWLVGPGGRITKVSF